MRPDRLITIQGFLHSIVEQHSRRKDRPFCFIVGAGASRASGIETGSEMARGWLQQLHEAEDFESLTLEKWATPENLGIEGFDLNNLGRFYPEIYERRFADSPQAGYACLEDKMQGKEPSYGYSVLAYLLSATSHKVVITTNFDNLVADALSIHSETFPVVVGHDALASYAQVDLRRPLIAKVHGGLGFAMKSTPEELTALSATWQKSLHRIFERYSPIVIGYDGNDGSLMSFLEGMGDGIIDGFYWCFHCPSGDIHSSACAVPQRVKDLVERKHGRLVPIPGFDELMLLIRERFAPLLAMPDLLDRMKERARVREKTYDEQQRMLTEKIRGPKVSKATDKQTAPTQPQTSTTEVSKLLQDAAKDLARDRKSKPWWLWEVEARAAISVDEKDRIYQEALSALPNSSELIGNYALFLNNERKDLDQAEEFYRRAIEADPKDADFLGNYALFLKNERKEMDQAEEFFKRAIEADPKRANNLGNYAVFLNYERKDLDQAEEFFKRAIEADPKEPDFLGNYAVFLKNERKEMDQAEEFFKRAIEADPKHANTLGNYALFLQNERKDLDQAEEFYKGAIKAVPKNPDFLCNYAVFLKNERKEMDQAEEFYKRAIEVDPKHANTLCNYANFIWNERKKMDHAEEFYKRAIEVDPKHANTLGNYAQLCFVERRSEEGLQLLKRAGALKPEAADLKVELAFYHLAHNPDAWPSALPEMVALLASGARSPGWNLDGNVAAARESRHPNPDLLSAIAGVISKGESLESLLGFADWPKQEPKSKK